MDKVHEGSSSLHPLRREAYAFEWNSLTRQQQGAVGQIADILVSAVDALDATREVASGSFVMERRSQLAFVDGDRGMGKTSVLLAIRRLMEEESPVTGLPSSVKTLQKKHRRLVWLETLDMEPLPQTANLLAAILARISEELDGPLRRSLGRAAGIFGDLDEHEKVVSNLQQLTLDAVLAWRGAEPRRAERIEPTVYAEEVLTSERAGLRFNKRLDDVLDGLAKLISTDSKTQDPLFIIPVDDFDLAATRCLELLRIIRMVSSARLFFVIAGNTRIAETVLRLQCEGELSSLAGDHMTRIEAVSVRLAATEIAANNLRKLVPPEQRARLTEVPLSEALDFTMAPGTPPLNAVLDAIFFDRNNAPPERMPCSLKTFVLVDDSGESIRYSGANWFGGKPRQILDKVALFCATPGKLTEISGESLLRALAEDLQRVAREDSHLPLELRDQVVDVFDTVLEVRFGFLRVFTLRYPVENRQSITFPKVRMVFQFPGAAEWRVRAVDASGTNREQRIQYKRGEEIEDAIGRIPDRLAAGLTFMHDLAISMWGGYVRPFSMLYQTDRMFQLVSVHWSELREDETPIYWHVPEWWTFREIERFWEHWRLHWMELSTVDGYAAGWLTAMLEIVMEVRPDRSEKGRSTERLLRLLNELAAETSDRFARRYLCDSVLVVVALLLAPESGCSEAFANSLLAGESDFVAALSKEAIAYRVRSWRAGRFVSVLNQVHLRERALTALDAELLSVINAKQTLDIAARDAERFLESHRRRMNLTEEPDAAVDSLKAQLEKFTQTNVLSGRRLEALRHEAEGKEISPCVEALAFAWHAQTAKFAINDICGGTLVPSHAEIAAINVEQPFSRRNP